MQYIHASKEQVTKTLDSGGARVRKLGEQTEEQRREKHLGVSRLATLGNF